MTIWGLSELPFNIDLETKKVLKALTAAHAALAELKGIASTIRAKKLESQQFLNQDYILT